MYGPSHYSDQYKSSVTELVVTFPKDADGFVGRCCPNGNCKKYFKIDPTTGLSGSDAEIHCPYCGHGERTSAFATQEQIDYGNSLLHRQVLEESVKRLQAMSARAFKSAPFPMWTEIQCDEVPVQHYKEQILETHVNCNKCALRFAIYGVFGLCPSCTQHNSDVILQANLEIIRKTLALAASLTDAEMKSKMIASALTDCVAAFDGFGRETCRAFSCKAVSPPKAEEIRFQNLNSARNHVKAQFGVDLSACVSANEWTSLVCAFQKRHLLAHKMGVIDEDYLEKTSQNKSLLGRKVALTHGEVIEIHALIGRVASELFRLLEAKT